MCAVQKDNLHSLGEEYPVQLKEYGSYCYRKVDPSRLRSGKFTVGMVYRAWLVISTVWCSLIGKFGPLFFCSTQKWQERA